MREDQIAHGHDVIEAVLGKPGRSSIDDAPCTNAISAPAPRWRPGGRDIGHRFAAKGAADDGSRTTSVGRPARPHKGEWPAGRSHAVATAVAAHRPACGRRRRSGGCRRRASRRPSHPRCASSGTSSRRGDLRLGADALAASSVSFGVTSPVGLLQLAEQVGAIVSRSQPASSMISPMLRKLAPITSVL